MFTTNLSAFKIQQEELQRRAAHYRLVRSLETRQSLKTRLSHLVGDLMVNLGRQLVSLSRAAS